MKNKSKSTIQSGAIVTFFNGLLFKFIQLSSCSNETQDLLVYLSTPVSLVLTWGGLIVIKIVGDFKAEDISLNRATKKDINNARKTIINPNSTDIDKASAKAELTKLLAFQKSNKAKRLNRLAKASEQAQSSTEDIKAEVQ